jgi:hypothetical protein
MRFFSHHLQFLAPGMILPHIYFREADGSKNILVDY